MELNIEKSDKIEIVLMDCISKARNLYNAPRERELLCLQMLERIKHIIELPE